MAEQNIPQQQPSIDEQISMLLAHFNRAINNASKEAEAALIKVVQNSLEIQKQFAEYKQVNPPKKPETKTEPTSQTLEVKTNNSKK